jgi:hypothetical protein
VIWYTAVYFFPGLSDFSPSLTPSTTPWATAAAVAAACLTLATTPVAVGVAAARFALAIVPVAVGVAAAGAVFPASLRASFRRRRNFTLARWPARL